MSLVSDFIYVFSPLLIPLAIFSGCVFIFMLMRPRRFYFIRHGETLLNAEHIRQGEEGSLSSKGREQAERVGQYLKNFSIQKILTSTYPRARETAEIIQTHLNVPVIASNLLIERRNPSEIVGKSTTDPEVIRIVDQMDLAYHEDEYHFSDEESFIAERKRARRCLNFLSRRTTRGTVVVTHHHFLKMLIAYLLYRNNLHFSDYIKIAFFNVSDNAGITICEFHPWLMFSKTHGWEVVSYNEQPK